MGSLWAQEGRERSEGEALTGVKWWVRNGEGDRHRCREPEGKSEKERQRQKCLQRDRETARDRDRDTKRDGDKLPEPARDEDRRTEIGRDRQRNSQKRQRLRLSEIETYRNRETKTHKRQPG